MTPIEREDVMIKRRLRAASAIANAIRKGDIPPAKTLVCVDCGKPAEHYDHRDYSKPLEVDPVCRGCNTRRGPGAPYDGYSNGWNKRHLATVERFKAIQKKRAK